MSNRLHLILQNHQGESLRSIRQAIKVQLTEANAKRHLETSETNLLQAIEQYSTVLNPSKFTSLENAKEGEIRRCELELYEVLLELHASGIHIVKPQSATLEPS